MSAGHSEPQLLYSVNGIRAYHVQGGEEHEISTSGPQTLSLLMVPTSPSTGLATTQPTSAAPEEDFYLHLHLPPEIDLPLPATTKVYHKPPTSYLIPRWDLDTQPGANKDAFLRVEFPSLGTGPGKVTQDEIDTFETILAQCTAFLERAQPPQVYNPALHPPGDYANAVEDTTPRHGHIVLVDEENGGVIAELENFKLVENASVQPGSKDPVEITLPENGNDIKVSKVSEEYLAMARHPAFANSNIVQYSATASRLLVTTTSNLSRAMTNRAENFKATTVPNAEPMTFSPTTHTTVRHVHDFTQSAVGLSAKTVGQVSKYAQNLGAILTGKEEKDPNKPKAGFTKDGEIDEGYKPGFFNKTAIAFSTIADGLDQSARALLSSGSTAASSAIGHKYGAEAGDVSRSLTGGVKNVGLVYIDALGVSRRALIKSVAKGMIVGKTTDGKKLVVGGGDGGSPSGVVVDPEGAPSLVGADMPKLSSKESLNEKNGVSVSVQGFGNEKVPPANPGIGDPIQGQKAPVKQ